MPSYFEMLKMADPAVMQDQWWSLLRAGGLIGALATFALVLSVLWFFVGLFSWRRGRVQQAAFLAMVSLVVGWVGSYLGYSQAAKTVAAANSAPKAEELASAANQIGFIAFAPSVGAVGVILLCGLVSLVVRGKKSDPEPEGA